MSGVSRYSLNPCCVGKGDSSSAPKRLLPRLSLNPCCVGKGDSTKSIPSPATSQGLNPCCVGKGDSIRMNWRSCANGVLILVVLERVIP